MKDVDTKISFSLIGLNTEQFALFEDNLKEEPSPDLNITTSIEFKVNPEKRQIGVFVSFSLKQTDDMLIKIQTSSHFSISSSSWKNFMVEAQIIFPKNFMAHLAMLAIGTTRGILHAKTEGSLLNKYILPTINVSELVEEDFIFSLS